MNLDDIIYKVYVKVGVFGPKYNRKSKGELFNEESKTCLGRYSIDTYMLLKISRVLDYDFFSLYSDNLRNDANV